MNRSAARHFVFSSAIAFFATITPALAQHGGGGGHASAVSSAHFGGSGSIGTSSSAASNAASSTSHASSTPSHVTSSNNSAASSSAARPSFATRSSSGSSFAAGSSRALSSANSARGASSASAPYSSVPHNVTIGFPPRAIPIATPRTESSSVSIAHSNAPTPRASHMSFFGDGNEVWQEPTHAPAHAVQTKAASRAAVPTTNKPLFGNPIATPPSRPRHPIFSGNGFGSGGNSGTRGFGGFFFDLGWGINPWDTCDPAWAFGCNAFADPVNGAIWEPSTAWYSADDSGDGSSCGDPCTNTWQDPPAPGPVPPDPQL